MIGSRAWRALMLRNMVYRKRNIIFSILELCLPILFVFFLVLIKISVDDTDGFSPEIIPAYYPTNNDVITTFSFTDYVKAIQAKRICQYDEMAPYEFPFRDFETQSNYVVSGIYGQGYHWQVPFVKCDSRLCEEDNQNAYELCEYFALGVAPLTEDDDIGLQQANEFRDYIYNRYPQLLKTSVTNEEEEEDEDDTMPFNFDFVQMFNSDKDIEKYVSSTKTKTSNEPKLALAVVFDGSEYPTINYNYKIRVNSTNYNSPEDEARPAVPTTPPTNTKLDRYAVNDDNTCGLLDGTAFLGPKQNSCTGQYIYNGALIIQRLVNDFILDNTGSKDAGYYVSEHGVQYAPFPTKEYEENGFYAAIASFAPLLITLGLLYPVAAMLRYMVLEKELRQKELMKMMSVTESDIGWSWFMTFLLFHLFTATGSAAFTAQLYSNSSLLLIWIFWVFTMMSIICFCMFLSTLFTKATRVTMVGVLLFFVGYFLTLVVDSQDDDLGTITLSSLHPVGAFAFGMQEIGRLEDLGVGLTVDSMSSTDSTSGYTFLSTLSTQLFACVFWGLASWYFNRVLPSEYGRPLPFYFPFTMSYWFPGSVRSHTLDGCVEEADNDAGVAMEPVSKALRDQAKQGKSIEIRNLRKVFGEKTAVDGLSLSMYNGQITALLGHNGAGKTTTISMLTGMLAPTEGYATVAGKDIRSDMTAIRQEIGICLQHDCLFPELTVREHVQFFARLKGMYSKMSRREAEEKVDASIQDVALSEKRNTLSKNLSGGMKRKLSVAIAFCGDSKTVLLDEPTSGMDPFSRRFTWNVIRQYRQDRCIILTTHFMDEADILGDRIAIMAEGQLRCAGSSLFLKKTYGVGYQLTIEKQPTGQSKDRSGAKKKNNMNSDPLGTDERLTDIVLQSASEATLLSNVGTELSFQLPLGAASGFAEMFEELDSEVDSGGIVTYGVGVTTLDEVFLLVARGDAATGSKASFKSSRRAAGEGIAALKDDDTDKSVQSRMDLENEGLFLRHLGGLFRKRAVNFKRDKKAWCCTTVLPTLFVLGGFLIFAFAAPQRNLDPIVLDLDDFNKDITIDQGARNPISFNNPGEYSCKPGGCIYELPFVENEGTGESYTFCGAPIDAFAQGLTCSIEDSSRIMLAGFTDAGAVPFSDSSNHALESSESLAASASLHEATQYGAIYFTRDASSTVDLGTSSIAGDQPMGDDMFAGLGALAGNFSMGFGDLGSLPIGDILSLVDLGALSELDGIQQFQNVANIVCLSVPDSYLNSSECSNYGGIGYIVRYNYTMIHAAPLFQSLADEAIVREATRDDEFRIRTTIHPLPLTAVENELRESADAFSSWFLITLGFPFILGAFATFVVAERQSKAKHLQTVAGVKPPAYWLSTWLWDVANYQIPCWLTVALMFIFDVKVYTTSENGVFGGVLTLLLLYGPAGAAYSYCISFMFTSPSICNLVLIISGFLVGLGGSMAAFILRLIGANPADPKDHLVLAAKIVEWVLRFIPSFNLSKGLFNATNLQTFQFLAGEDKITVWHESVLFWEVVFMAAQSIVYLLLAMKIDEWSANPRAVSIWKSFVNILTFKFLCPVIYVSDGSETVPDDDDVLAEQERVLSGRANDDLIVLSQLSKVYDNGKRAVNNMSLGIPPGQCFGLLGINGAGKTTTMGMLTAEFPPTSGDATLAGYSVTQEPERTRRRVGYCPQFDAHFTNMTGREHVELYASIKGVPIDLVKEAAVRKLNEVGLSPEDSDRLSAGYSGGMKRRLSLACATIGQPQIVFLDECSTGVDPVARREIWQMISDMVTGGDLPPEERPSVILTTHSMEECEALCPNIGIMAGGKLRCLGSAQRLKSKFGQGFQVELKIKTVEKTDRDFLDNYGQLASTSGVSLTPDESEEGQPVSFLTLERARAALENLTGDGYLSGMVNDNDPHGYIIYKDATSPTGVQLDELTNFATSELRMRNLQQFIATTYPNSLLRERQDLKTRYEVSNQGVRIGNIFANIEKNKSKLLIAEYGVSQTSLEQVFNMHALEAERLKNGTNDG